MIFVLVLALVGPSLIEACGRKPYSARVVNGEDASPHAWPWQISLRVRGRHICGGSLIDPDWVVTAAHCVDRNPSPSGYTVVVGAHRRTGITSVQQTLRLKQLFKHKTFGMRHLKNDIALLQLERPVQISAQVNTVCLPQAGSQAQTGSRCYITGWGRTVGGGKAADILQQAMLPVADYRACSQKNGGLVPIDRNSMICAGGQGRGGCQGDSGGPFVCEEGGRWVLRGAVSWGHHKCRTDYYTVFARISSFIDWINYKKSDGGGGGGGGGGGDGGGGDGGGGSGNCSDQKPRSCPGWISSCSHPVIKQACKKTCNAC